MTIQEFYQLMEGDYERVLDNVLTPENVLKFVKMFLKDPNYEKLVITMQDKDYEEAFKAAHTLKGVAANLSFERLYEVACEVTEGLRDGTDIETAIEMMPKLSKEYEMVITAIQEL